MNIKKKGKLIIINNYSFRIKKISGFSVNSERKSQHSQKENIIVHYLTIFFDGNKIDFYNNDKNMLEKMYKKLIKILKWR